MIVTKGELAREAVSRYRSQIALVIISVMMILVGFICRANYGDYSDVSDFKFKFYAAYTILVFTGGAGIAASVFFRGTTSSGLILLGLTVYFFFMTAGSFVKGFDEDMEEYAFMLRLAIYILLSFCVVFSIKIMIGSTVNTARAVWMLWILILLFFLEYIVDLHHDISTIDSVAGKSDYIGMFVVSVTTVLLIGFTDSRYVSPMKRLRLNVEALEATEVTFDNTYMLRQSLRRLTESREYWSDSEDGSKREITIQLYNRIRRDEMIVKEWFDGTLVCTILPRSRKIQLYKGFTFPIRHIVTGDIDTTGLVRIYGDNGFFVEIAIRDTHIKRYRSLREVKALFQFWKE